MAFFIMPTYALICRQIHAFSYLCLCAVCLWLRGIMFLRFVIIFGRIIALWGANTDFYLSKPLRLNAEFKGF